MHNTTIGALNQTRLLEAGLLRHRGGLDPLLFLAEHVQLVFNDIIEQASGVFRLLSVDTYRSQKLVLVGHGQLVCERIAPVTVLG